jgi:DNA-binding transcriptional regulator YhcF (GntR family)
MLAYPTPTFDAKTILQAPGYRPAGRGAEAIKSDQPEAVTPLNLVNRNTANGFVGTRAKKFIQNNQFNTSENSFDPTKGTPLSKPGSVGNVNDLAISCKPVYAEPENGELRAIMAILNGKGTVAEHAGKLSAKQVASLEKKGKGLVSEDGAKRVVEDFSDSREALRKETMIRKAVRQGFSLEEAQNAYSKVRVKEAEVALMKEEDPSTRLYDLIDSKIAGTQNGSIRGNDETGLFLAQGKNAVMVKKAEDRNDAIENAINRARGRGRPSDKALAEMSGQTIEEIKESRKIEKRGALRSKLGGDPFVGKY